MNILHSSDRALVVHGDWRELELGTATIDVTITDPPYEAHVHDNAKSNGFKSNGYTIPLDFEPLEDFEHVPLLLDITKRWVLCFASLEHLGPYKEAAGGWRTPKVGGAYVRSGVYKRIAPMPQLTGDRPGQAAEGLAIMHGRARKMHWNSHGKAGLWEDDRAYLYIANNVNPTVLDKAGVLGMYPATERAAIGHRLPEIGCMRTFKQTTIVGLDCTTQPHWWAAQRATKEWKCHNASKPEALCAALIESFSNENETVFDPYAGGGNIGIKALQMGRNVVMCEIDADHAAACAARVKGGAWG